MDVRLINPFVSGIKNVFSTMLATDVLISKPIVKGSSGAKVDVSAIIGFSGEANGSVALCFPLRTAVSVASKFSGAEVSERDEDFADALGELANMVAGKAKSQLEGVTASISLPRVVVGREMRLLTPQNSTVLLFPCDSTLGRFSAEVTIDIEKEPRENAKPVLQSSAY